MPRTVVLVIVLLVVPMLAHAQVAVGSLAALQPRLPVGASVVVTERDGTEVRGVVLDLGPDGIELSARRAVKRYAEADVALIERRYTDNLLNGTAIGAAIGAGSAMAIYLLFCAYGEDCSDAAQVFGAYALIGGAIGLGVDASVRPLRPIFIAGLAPPAAPRWSVSPVLANRGGGAALRLTF